MRVVIDIPDDKVPDKQDILDLSLHFIDGTVCEADGYGFMVLPKGHGDLVDISKLYEQKIEQWNPFVEFLGEEYVPTGAIETYATVIIPADKGEE